MRLRAPALTFFFVTACGGSDGELSFRFTDEATQQATTSIAVTVFEPLEQSDAGGDIELITCDRVGTFPAARKLDPEDLRLGGGLGRLLGELRKSQNYPLDGDLELDFTAVPEGDQSDPWGLAMVLIEARAVVRSADPEGGSPIATIAAGCTCIRARDGRSRDSRLDTLVKKECPTLEEQPERDLDLKPVLPNGFKLEPCNDTCATSMDGGPIGGTRGCINRIACNGSNDANCFECDSFECTEQDDFSNVPIVFSAGDTSEILLSTKSGKIDAQLMLATCTEGQNVATRVLGRKDVEFEQSLACVPPVLSFDCTDMQLADHNNAEVLAVSSLARNGVVLLYEGSNATTIDILDPRAPDRVISRELPNRRALGVRAYQHDPRTNMRPLIAVATSTRPDLSEQIRLHLFDWTPTSINPIDTYNMACPDSACADSDCPTGARSNRTASISEADIDSDGLNDIAVAGDTGYALVVGLLSSLAAPGELYSSAGCTCGQYGSSLALMELGDIGGVLGDKIDVLFTGGFGLYAQFGNLDGRLPCGGPPLIAQAVARDLALGRFGCDPAGPDELSCGSCGHGTDAVVVGGELAGISQSAVQVVLARDTNDDSSARAKTNVIIEAGKISREGATQAEVGDFNRDGADDLALLFAVNGAVHVWLGARNGALAQSPVSVAGGPCAAAKMTIADFDGDGISEIALVCNPTGDPVLRRCVPRLTQP